MQQVNPTLEQPLPFISLFNTENGNYINIEMNHVIHFRAIFLILY